MDIEFLIRYLKLMTTEKRKTTKKEASFQKRVSEERASVDTPVKRQYRKVKKTEQPEAKSVVADDTVVDVRKTPVKRERKPGSSNKNTGIAASASSKAGKVVPRASMASLFGGDVVEQNFSEEPPEWVKPEWIPFYRNLYLLRARLKNQMNGLAEDSSQAVTSFGMHMADTGTDHFDRDFALSLLSADQDALYEVEQALKRIQKGTYGVCEMTGEPIPLSRLEAIPWTRFTVEAQAQLEKEGALKSRRLGALGTIGTTAEEMGGVSGSEEDEEGEDKLAHDKD